MNSGRQGTALRLFGVFAVVAVLVIAIAIFRVHRERASPNEATVDMVEAGASAPSELAIPAPSTAESPQSIAGVPPEAAAGVQHPDTPRRIYFRNTKLDSLYGRLAYRDGQDGQTRSAGELSCEVAYASRRIGICLVAKRGVVTRYFGRLFDTRDFAVRKEFDLQGTPSRSRVSTDGRLAAYTVFLSGHGYDSLDFSTQTVILDAASGEPMADLETDFNVLRDGATINGADFNFWGVTFPDEANAFYATLSTGGRHYLVRGDLKARTMTVLHENVECPSVSPDGRRIAYKKRFNEGGRVIWQLHVLDLASQKETALAERRSIDDQLEWLDNGHVLYSVPSERQDMGGGTDVWAAATDGAGAPRLFITSAYSPSVVR
jgi:hypothetical protein